MSKKRETTVVAYKLRTSEIANKRKKRKKSDKNNINSTVQEYIAACKASSTKRAYASDLRHFLAHSGSVPCTPKRLAKYLAESANDGLTVATLERRVTAIHKAHVEQKHQSPAQSEMVKQVMQGIRRTLGTKQRQVKPLRRDDLMAALNAMEGKTSPLKSARDRALLLVGFASAMRRSELVRIRVENLSFSAKGLEIELPVSKTDQERFGRTVLIPEARSVHCPVKALQNWLTLSGINDGCVFRAVNRFDGIAQHGLSAQSVALIVKAAVIQGGWDASKFSGHSLRAGYCTSAAELGLPAWLIREQSGHKSEVTLARYIRSASFAGRASLL